MKNNTEKMVRMNYFVENHRQAIGEEPHTTICETEIVGEGYTLYDMLTDNIDEIAYTDHNCEWSDNMGTVYCHPEIVEVADGVYDVIDPDNDNYIVEEYILKDYEEIEEA